MRLKARLNFDKIRRHRVSELNSELGKSRLLEQNGKNAKNVYICTC